MRLQGALLLAVLAGTLPPAAAAPVTARGEALLPLDAGACLAAARRALRAESYVVPMSQEGSSVAGSKPESVASVACASRTTGQATAFVLVASDGADPRLPEAERSRLIARLRAVAAGTDTTPEAVPLSRLLRLEAPSFGTREKITVHWRDLPGNSSDWITLVPADASDSSYSEWTYTGGKREGSYTFRGVEKPGAYEVRVYFNWSGGGGYKVQDRLRFPVEYQ